MPVILNLVINNLTAGWAVGYGFRIDTFNTAEQASGIDTIVGIVVDHIVHFALCALGGCFAFAPC